MSREWRTPSHCNCFYGTWYAYSVPATVWWKFFCYCGDREPPIVILRGLFWICLIFPWLCIICFLLLLFGILMDILWFIIWAISCGYCCYPGECFPDNMERCCQSTDRAEPWPCLQ